MKSLTWIAILGAGALLVGCNNSSDNQKSAANDTGSSKNGREVNAPSPTSRDQEPNRVYSGSNNNTGMVAPDNTKRNAADQGGLAPSAQDQPNDAVDLELTRKIRQEVTGNGQLSAEAKNIKIVSVNGRVTLRGPVNSESERKLVGDLAQQMGASEVDNQLEVKTPNQ